MNEESKKEITSICSKWAVMLHQSMLQFNDITDEQLDKMRNMVITFIDQLVASEVEKVINTKIVRLKSTDRSIVVLPACTDVATCKFIGENLKRILGHENFFIIVTDKPSMVATIRQKLRTNLGGEGK